MKNEFTAIIEPDGDWFVGYCPEIPALMAKAELLKNARKAWPMRLHSFWKIVARIVFQGCLRMRFVQR